MLLHSTTKENVVATGKRNSCLARPRLEVAGALFPSFFSSLSLSLSPF